MIMSTSALQKVECLNPNTGGRMNISREVYDLFSKAIYHTLKGGHQLTYTQLVEGIYDCLQKKKIRFEKSVEWYAVVVKNDMEARGLIETVSVKGKKLNRLKK